MKLRAMAIPLLLIALLTLSIGLGLAQAAYITPPVNQENEVQVRNRAQLMLDICERLCLRINNSLQLYNITLSSDLKKAYNESLQKLHQLKLMMQTGEYQAVITEAIKLLNKLRPIVHYVMNHVKLNLEAQHELEVNASAKLNLRFLRTLNNVVNASLNLNVTLPKPLNTTEIKEKIHEITEAIKTNATKIREKMHEIRNYVKELVKELRNATRVIILPVKVDIAVMRHLRHQLMRAQEMTQFVLNESKEKAEQAIENAITAITLTIERLKAMKEFVQETCKAKVEVIRNAIDALNRTLTRLINIRDSILSLTPVQLREMIMSFLGNMSNTTSTIVENIPPQHHGKMGEEVREQVHEVIEQVHEIIENLRHQQERRWP